MRIKKPIITLIVLLIFSLQAQAEGAQIEGTQIKDKAKSAKNTHPHTELSKERFLTLFIPHFKKQACEGVFKECFTLDKTQCLSSTAMIIEICAVEVGGHMPKIIKSAHDSGNWGSKIAVCIKNHFAQKHQKMLLKDVSICKSLILKTVKKNKPQS